MELITLIKGCTDCLNPALSDDELWEAIGSLKYIINKGCDLAIGTLNPRYFKVLMVVGNTHLDKLKEKIVNRN